MGILKVEKLSETFSDQTNYYTIDYKRLKELLDAHLGIKISKDELPDGGRKLGDLDADSLYCLKCMKRDTIYYDSLGNISTAENSFKFENRERSLFDTSMVSDTFIRGNDGLYTLSLYNTFSVKCKNPKTKLPSFSGGLSGIQKTDVLKMAPAGIMSDFDEIFTNCSDRIS